MALDSHDVALPPSERILLLLGLEKLSIAEELRVLVGGRFRVPQQVQLSEILSAMQSTIALANVAFWFSHQFDPTRGGMGGFDGRFGGAGAGAGGFGGLGGMNGDGMGAGFGAQGRFGQFGGYSAGVEVTITPSAGPSPQ
ncbi:hypothetical protein PF010_g11665 [Phytophthora fragariae]|uniref:Uncharacterized protein n=2 Tax=Phytophthora fragariae TaxID=53985 RepID=A0A6A3KKG4_9STRA|nr:hypothetical protein PF011_g10935 [Phytophthora fragariae]KAE9109107.1 hypothetical protein PF010_g11665 [Phytophthora fragariae]KAE9197304.1 hypothetical protein PF004_g19869 [Phytophthora fragariae]